VPRRPGDGKPAAPPHIKGVNFYSGQDARVLPLFAAAARHPPNRT
jgi:hypothetical protein